MERRVPIIAEAAHITRAVIPPEQNVPAVILPEPNALAVILPVPSAQAANRIAADIPRTAAVDIPRAGLHPPEAKAHGRPVVRAAEKAGHPVEKQAELRAAAAVARDKFLLCVIVTIRQM
jgi:hypothetical protein